MIRYLLRSCPWAAGRGMLKECILTAGQGRTWVPAGELSDENPAFPHSSTLGSRPQQAGHHLHTAEGGAPLGIQNQTLVFSTRTPQSRVKPDLWALCGPVRLAKIIIIK